MEDDMPIKYYSEESEMAVKNLKNGQNLSFRPAETLSKSIVVPDDFPSRATCIIGIKTGIRDVCDYTDKAKKKLEELIQKAEDAESANVTLAGTITADAVVLTLTGNQTGVAGDVGALNDPKVVTTLTGNQTGVAGDVGALNDPNVVTTLTGNQTGVAGDVGALNDPNVVTTLTGAKTGISGAVSLSGVESIQQLQRTGSWGSPTSIGSLNERRAGRLGRIESLLNEEVRVDPVILSWATGAVSIFGAVITMIVPTVSN